MSLFPVFTSLAATFETLRIVNAWYDVT